MKQLKTQVALLLLSALCLLTGAYGQVTLPHHVPKKVQNGSALPIGHYNPEQMLRLVLAVQAPYMAEEEQFIQELVTKGSPNFHQFLTPEDWNARFAPAAEDEQKVADWAQSQGLTVTKRYANRLIVDVEAPAGMIEKAFGVTINNYQVGDEVDFSNDRDPAIPDCLSGIVHGVLGLNGIERVHRLTSGANTQKGPDYVAGPVSAAGAAGHGDGDPTRSPAYRAASVQSDATPAAPPCGISCRPGHSVRERSSQLYRSIGEGGIVEWVRAGGILLLFGNDKGNAEFEHLNMLAERFGIHFNEDSRNRVQGNNFEMGAFADLPSHPMFKDVNKIYLKEISTLKLSGDAKPILTDKGDVIIGYSKFGQRVRGCRGRPVVLQRILRQQEIAGSVRELQGSENLFRWLLQDAKTVRKNIDNSVHF